MVAIAEMSKTTTPDLRAGVEAVLADRGLTLAAAARSIGVSASALSSWMHRSYRGDNDRLDALVGRWLTTEAEVAARRTAGLDRHADLAATDDIDAVCHHAQANGDMALVYGAAGAGKTWTLRRFAGARAGAWLVTMSPAVTTPAAALGRIAAALDAGGGETTAARLERAVIEYLAGVRHAVLLVDEAHHLTAALLDVIRCVHDASGAGVVLSGNEPLWARLASGERAAQLVSRIGLRRRLRRPTEADVLTLAETLLRVRPTGPAREAVVAAGKGIGGLRAVRKLAGHALAAAAGGGRERVEPGDVLDAAAALEAA